jgi:hypothetical protein
MNGRSDQSTETLTGYIVESGHGGLPTGCKVK